VAVVNHNVNLPQPISLEPISAAISGCITLKNGVPAARSAISPYQTAGVAEVSAVGAAGQTLAGPVPVNSAACYVLSGVPETADWSVVVQYEAATARRPVTSEILTAPAGAVVNIVLPNDPPTITGFSASLDGNEVSQAPPGSKVTVKVDATSSSNFALHYKWADGTGTPIPGDQASVEWNLPGTKALNIVYVEVSDGHGGVARASLPVSTDLLSKAGQALPAATYLRFNLITPGNGGPIPFPPNPHFQHSGPFIDPTIFMPCGTPSDPTTCSAAAQSYYVGLGVLAIVDGKPIPKGSYVNFRTWKAAWGFSDDPTSPGPNETRGVYYNNNDLEFGRDMHCLAINGIADPATTFVASIITNVCYVANYSPTGAAGGDPPISIFNAENNKNTIAVVAMVNMTIQTLSSAGSAWTNDPILNFVVFAPRATGIPVPADEFVPSEFAVLDTEGPKAVPGVCMACHGGGDTSKVNTSGARFLPFDTPSYLYDNTVGSSFSKDSQREEFRRMNVIARNADTDAGGPLGSPQASITSQTIRDLVDGWYSWCKGVETPGCYIDEDNPTHVLYRVETARPPVSQLPAGGSLERHRRPTSISRFRALYAGLATSRIRMHLIGRTLMLSVPA
jgi:hypothetical protein